MTDLWQLPESAVLGGRAYPHHTDFRRILKILQVLEAEDYHPLLRWYRALALFFREPVPRHLEGEAMAYLGEFLRCGREDPPGPKLLDWQGDAAAIIADVNAVAGRDLRREAELHWWSFLSFFHGIGQGQLSLLVSVRKKLVEGKALEPWEREFCRTHPNQVKLPRRETPEEAAHRNRLEEMLRK